MRDTLQQTAATVGRYGEQCGVAWSRRWRALTVALCATLALASVMTRTTPAIATPSNRDVRDLAATHVRGWVQRDPARGQQAAAAMENLRLAGALAQLDVGADETPLPAVELLVESLGGTPTRMRAKAVQQGNVRRAAALMRGSDPFVAALELLGAPATARAAAPATGSFTALVAEAPAREAASVLEAVRQLPAPHRLALDQLAAAFVELRDSAGRYYATMPATAVEAELPRVDDGAAQPPLALDAADARPLGAESRRLQDAQVELVHAVRGVAGVWAQQPINVPAADCAVLPGVLAIDLSGQDCTYPFGAGVPLSIDVGGADRYLSTVGGNGYDGVCTAYGTEVLSLGDRTRAGVALDLSGDDEYYGSCGSNGGGNEGVGFLFDGSGDDLYRATGLGANGGGAVLGHGMLIDVDGADRYEGEGRGMNGGAFGGSRGRLIDAAGDDVYRVSGHQSAGANGGAGNGTSRLYALVESAGALVDLDGDDHYASTSGFGANGGGYWAGNGFLLDRAGADSYEGGDHGVNGGAVFEATGFLLDAGDQANSVLSGAPNDHGWTMSHGGNGGGARNGVGLLVGGAGADTYQGGGNASNGGGVDGAGLLVDAGGSDAYLSGEGTGVNGGAANIRLLTTAGEHPQMDHAIGALVDFGRGDDRYRAGRTARFVYGGTHVSPEGGAVNGGANNVHPRDALDGLPMGIPPRGFLFDDGGDDAYTGVGSGLRSLWPPAGGVNGGGAFYSVGTLVDMAGNDQYDGGVGRDQFGGVATNGGAFALGMGLLLDASGHDRYTADGEGTNGGATGASFGLLADGSGNDGYIATTQGTNGGGDVGGIGALYDLGGDDWYEAGSNGSNGGGYGGEGLLYDASGNDRYTATMTGWHPEGGSNGGGRPYLHHPGRGLLVDGHGDDEYEAADASGVNGGGLRTAEADSTGLLLDCSGVDRYVDDQGGAGDDVTAVPKEDAGAQLDVGGRVAAPADNVLASELSALSVVVDVPCRDHRHAVVDQPPVTG